MYVPAVAKVLPDAGVPVTGAYKLKEGDLILAIEGKNIYLLSDMTKSLEDLKKKGGGAPFEVAVMRDGVRQNVEVVLRNYLSEDQDGNDIELYGLGIERGSSLLELGFFESIGKGIVYCFKMGGVILGFFGDLITGAIGLNQLGGPITTIGQTAEWAKMGIRPLAEIIVLIGVNLAVFNALPIPALDGSKVLFILIEVIRRKPVNREIEGRIHFAGLLLLFLLVIVADLFQIFG